MCASIMGGLVYFMHMHRGEHAHCFAVQRTSFLRVQRLRMRALMGVPAPVQVLLQASHLLLCCLDKQDALLILDHRHRCLAAAPSRNPHRFWPPRPAVRCLMP